MQTDPKKAAAILEKLYEQSSTIRIQLELAKSLYLSGELERAKKEFIIILDRPIPLTVRDKVEWYLSEIQKRQSARIYLGLYQDSNPGYVTSARTVSIFGQTFSYQPAVNTSSETGLAIGVDIERELSPQSGYFIQGNINTATYQTNAFNKQSADFSIVKRWQAFDYKDLRFGHETMFYGGIVLYNYAYAASKWIFNRPNQDYYGFSIKGGSLNFPTYSYLTGYQVQGNTFYNHNILRNLSIYFETGGDKTPASIDAYSSYGVYGTVGMQAANESNKLQVNLKATQLARNYWESDPFWGQIRRDRGSNYNISITKRDLHIMGFRPVIEINYQNNNSNIPFFSYNKIFGGIFFRNVY